MILIIDNYDSFTYNLYQIVATINSEVVVLRNDKFTLDDIARMKPSAIILSPGPGRPEHAGLCIPLIQRYHLNYPILGVCLGFQAIVQSFGGNIIRAKLQVHGKQSLINHTQNGIFQDLPSPLCVGRYHSLIAEQQSIPDCLQVTATSEDNDIVMAVAHKQKLCYGVQFHPESILTKDGKQLIINFISLAKESNKC